MRILADENVSREIVESLRALGLDVMWIAEEDPGAPDSSIIERALEDSRVVLTFDKDFGEMAFSRMTMSLGITLIRVRGENAASVAVTVAAAIGSRNDWAGQFAVIEDDRLRMTPLPAAPD